MALIYLLLYLAALVCFVVATISQTPRRYNVMAAGLAFVTVVWIIQTLDRLIPG